MTPSSLSDTQGGGWIVGFDKEQIDKKLDRKAS
jgi:hypothetical protein